MRILPSLLSRKLWICTFSGIRYFPADPIPADVRIVDIAHALAYQCRYTGHCKKFYSVGEHSVLVSEVVPPEHALTALMHDAPEAYIHDISGPLKRSLPDYRAIEAKNWIAIADKYRLPAVLPACVKSADIAVLLAEMKVLMPPMPGDHGIRGEPANVQIMGLPPEEAESLFLHRFYQLTKGMGV